jgi:hypothetical protein
MKDDVERQLRALSEAVEEWERDRRLEDTDGNFPDSPVPAPVKPKPLGKVGRVALQNQTKTTPLFGGEE